MESIESAGLLVNEDQPQQTKSITPTPAIDYTFIINFPFLSIFVIIGKTISFCIYYMYLTLW